MTGNIVWKAELEGISDWVTVDEKYQQVIVTSSVFDIEYHDFIEGLVGGSPLMVNF